MMMRNRGYRFALLLEEIFVAGRLFIATLTFELNIPKKVKEMSINYSRGCGRKIVSEAACLYSFSSRIVNHRALNEEKLVERVSTFGNPSAA